MFTLSYTIYLKPIYWRCQGNNLEQHFETWCHQVSNRRPTEYIQLPDWWKWKCHSSPGHILSDSNCTYWKISKIIVSHLIILF